MKGASWIGTVETTSPAGYRPDVDGLRALAVLAVLGFHAAPTLVPGGFVGVDIFFVISGYLITSLVLSEQAKGSFRLGHFYARRVRRLFPALLTVLAASTLLAWLILPDEDLRRFGNHLAASAAFVPNFAFVTEFGYFDQPYSKPLLHLWSLGVEEQYYAVWPVILLLLALPRWRLWGIILIGLASFAFSLHLIVDARPWAFYSPLSRAWELMLGGLLAAAPGKWRIESRFVRSIGSLVGLTALAASLLLIDRHVAFPGLWALLPTMGTFLIIAAGPSAWTNRWLLSRRLLVGIGLISYPLYLWHWPLLSFGLSLTFDMLGWVWRAAIVALSFPLAILTFLWIERPIRERRAKPWPLLGGMALFALLGLLIQRTLLPLDMRPEVDARRTFFAAYRNLPFRRLQDNGFDCEYQTRFTPWGKASLPAACIAPGRESTWFLWGDSHGRSLSVGLRQLLPDGVALAQVTNSGCRPMMDPREICRASDRLALDLIRRLRPEIVLLVQFDGHDRVDWRARAEQLHALGASRVILVGPLPRWNRPVPQLVVTRYWPVPPLWLGDELRTEMSRTDEGLRRRWRSDPRLNYVSLIERLCQSDSCLVRVPGAGPREMMVYDNSHPTPAGSLYIARAILLPAIVGQRP